MHKQKHKKMDSKVRIFNAYQLAERADVRYNKLAESFKYESSKPLNDQEIKDLKKTAKDAYNYLMDILQKGQSL